MSSLATFSQKMRIFLPPSAGAVTSLMSMICSSFLALASKMLVEHTGSRATWNLPGCLGSSKKAWNKQHAKIKIHFMYGITWKHSLTAFKSMEEGLSMCLKPALKGSTRISRLCFSDSSISFFLTHWMPRCWKPLNFQTTDDWHNTWQGWSYTWNSTVISSVLTCKVHTPRLQPSLPT